jgi:uncharacterized integral membrane protein
MSDPSPKKDDKATVSAGGLKLTPKAIVAIVVGIAALIFVFSNTAEIKLQFLWLELSAPGWVLLLALFASGLAVGFFMGRNRYKR